MADIGIVIVTYNSAAQIGACLDAAMSHSAEIVVVDNASEDSTVEVVRSRPVTLIANRENRGFAAAANQGFAALHCAHILLLNPDAVILGGIGALRDDCGLPGSAGAGGCLLDPSGNPQVGFMVRNLPTPAALILESLLLNRIWSNNPVNRKYRGLGLDYSARLRVEQPAGAFLMLRREVWQVLGGFDERFVPLWFEDVDFCRRVADKGLHLYYEPKAIAKHEGAHSISRLTVEKRRIYWYRSLLTYSAKHFSPSALRAVCLAVISGSILRSVAEVVQRRSLRPLSVYGNVVRLAGRRFVTGC